MAKTPPLDIHYFTDDAVKQAELTTQLHLMHCQLHQNPRDVLDRAKHIAGTLYANGFPQYSSSVSVLLDQVQEQITGLQNEMIHCLEEALATIDQIRGEREKKSGFTEPVNPDKTHSPVDNR